jgi:hypothetical protein
MLNYVFKKKCLKTLLGRTTIKPFMAFLKNLQEYWRGVSDKKKPLTPCGRPIWPTRARFFRSSN